MYHHFFPLLMVTLFWQPTKADEESFIEEMTNFTQMEPPKESQSTYLEQRKFLDLANMQDDELMSPGQTKKVKTSQSTVFIPSQFPDKPMDGSSQSGNCVQTLQEDDPWWMADLGSTQIVNSISITNRKDCCQEQINGVIILVGDSADLNGKMNARCAKVPSLGLGMTQVSKCGTMKGRYVTIINPGREKVLSFCDVQIFGKPWDSGHNNSIISIDDFYPLLPVSDDVPEIPRSVHSSATSYNFDLSENHIAPVLSKGKPTFQSSIFSPTASPERAVDGSLLDDFERGTCIQTQEEINPWWMVDLGCTQTVKSVAITPRQDCCTEELHGALILVGDSPDTGGIFNARCAVINSLSQGKTEFFKCETMQGRYVSVVNPKRRTFLSFCEVRVFGKASDSISSSIATSSPESQPFLPKAYDQESRELPGPELSKQRPTSQSSVFIPSQFPEKPMDGSIQSGHCVQTLQETDPWWMVDLGSTQTIGSVSITNRKDCCQEQIKGTMILVGDSPYQGGKFNARCASIPFLDLGIKHVVSCEGMKGRYVTIIHPGREKVLSFCDVKVFGKIWNSDKVFPDELELSSHDSSYSLYNFDLMENNFGPVLSKGKPAFQSSISNPLGSPERAVDGSLLADFEKGTCIQTQREVNPWWMVDLGCTQTVKSVAITPRKDCCTEELRGALILVGDSPDGGGTLNARCAVIGFLDREKTETFRCGLIHGRYVSVLNPGKEKMISLCEVRVFGKASKFPPLDNLPISPKSLPSSPGTDNAMDSAVPVVSRGKPAFQSSVYSALGSPERAVDGSLLSDFNKGSCIQTYPENDPWWMVDLGSPYTVDSVSITSRRDCCSDLMNGAMILIGDSQYMNGRMNPRCAMVPAMRPGKTESFSCGSMKGRYVTITIPGRGKLLTMCEVQVFGKAFEGPEKLQAGDSGTQISNLVTLISMGKTASQSSMSHHSASPEKALDMSFQKDFGKSSCIQTLQESNPWWMVDLGSISSVALVSLTNRNDCCQEQINGAEILVGDSSFQGGKFNPKCAIISSMPPRKTVFFDCGVLKGRYVTIIIPGRRKTLTLCKVQILGSDPKASLSSPLPGSSDNQGFIPIQGTRFSISSTSTEIIFGSNPYQNYFVQISLRRKRVSQSSIFDPSGSPERAVDGSLESDFWRGSCIQTHQETGPWWMIDLESTQPVATVAITNRRDCCHEQINGAEILVGDSFDKGGKSNPRCARIFALGPGKTESFNCGSLRGRYVTITIPGRGKLLTFCEVQILSEMTQSLPGSHPSHHNLPPTSNKDISMPFVSTTPTPDGIKNYIRPCAPLLSQGMNVFQSSTSSLLGSPERAIDGCLAGNFSKGSCIQTLSEYEPWWMVDLDSSYLVDYVAITNRKDCCHEQLNGAVILVGDSGISGGKFNPRCATISSLDAGKTETFFCGSMNGRYVTVSIPGKNTFLTFCEVQVFGKLAPSLPHVLPKSPTDIHKPIGVNIALGKFTYQSSTFHSTGLSGKAVDGNEDSDFYKNSCTHTNKDFEPWWMVDLTSKFIVDNVTVIPRGDRCVGTMAKYEITIGDSKENGGKSNPRCGDKVNISPGEKHIFKCYGMQGRFITVTMPKVKEFLSLCEVEVFGEQLINSGDLGTAICAIS